MIYVVNKTNNEHQLTFKIRVTTAPGDEWVSNKGSNLTADQISEAQLRVVSDDGKLDHPLFFTSTKLLIQAILKRYQSGESRLKIGVTTHELYAEDAIMVADRSYKEEGLSSMEDGIILATIPSNPSKRSERERRIPMHTVVVITNIADNATTTINNPANCSEVETFDVGDYRFTVLLVRWVGWKMMKYRGAIRIQMENKAPIVYEMGYSVSDASKYAKDSLVELNPDGIAAFEAYEAELAKQQEARTSTRKGGRQYPSPDGRRPTYDTKKKKPRGGQQYGNRKPSNRPNTGNNRGGGYSRPQKRTDRPSYGEKRPYSPDSRKPYSQNRNSQRSDDRRPNYGSKPRNNNSYDNRGGHGGKPYGSRPPYNNGRNNRDYQK